MRRPPGINGTMERAELGGCESKTIIAVEDVTPAVRHETPSFPATAFEGDFSSLKAFVSATVPCWHSEGARGVCRWRREDGAQGASTLSEGTTGMCGAATLATNVLPLAFFLKRLKPLDTELNRTGPGDELCSTSWDTGLDSAGDGRFTRIFGVLAGLLYRLKPLETEDNKTAPL